MSCPCCIRNYNPLGLLNLSSSQHKRRAFAGAHSNTRKYYGQGQPSPTPSPSASVSALPSGPEPLPPSILAPPPDPMSLRADPPNPPTTSAATYPIEGSDMQKQVRRFFELLNDATKWWVSGVAFFILIAKHDEYVAWALTGSIVAAFNNKLLKRIINQARPADARKEDPGMPSSHAQSLAFLTTYAIIGLQSLGLEPPALQLFVSGTVAALGLFLAYLRVRLGFHTADQVVVGVGVGIGSALGWFYLGMQYAFPYFFVNEGAVVYLWATTAVAVVAFAGRTVIGWVQEKQLRKRLAAEKKEE